MPKLLQINVTANWGSTGKIAEDIGKVATANGWESYIAYGRDTKPTSTSVLIPIGNKWDMYYHGLHTRIFDNHGLASKKATRDFIEKVKQIDPDVIHLHNIHGYYINYEILFEYLSKAQKPVVWTLHDCWPFTGHCAHFDAVGCNKWKTDCRECKHKDFFPTAKIFSNSANNYIRKRNAFTTVDKMVIIPVSDWLSDLLNESFLSIYPKITIHNGIDINTFSPINIKQNNQKKISLIGVASVWTEKKGLNDFIELSKKLPEKYQITLVGVDDNTKEKLPNNIIAIKRTNSQKELAALYSMADIVLNLSYEETFGLTTVEGFACGTPGIVYNKTASPELITPETGIIINDAGNTNEIIKAINEITNKGKKYYSTACRERAVKLYNKEDRFNEYIELYNNLIKSSM